MKKLLSIILVAAILFSLSGCAELEKIFNKGNDKATEKAPDGTSPENTGFSSAIDTDKITSLTDFASTLKESGYETVLTTGEDGITTVKLVPPGPETTKQTENTEPQTDAVITPVTQKTEPVPDTDPTPTEPITAPPTDPPVETVPVPTDPPVTTPVVPITVPPETDPPTPPTPPAYTYTTGQSHTMLPYTERYLYSILDETQKDWYRKIDEAVRNLVVKTPIGAGLLENENYYIYYLYMMDTPELFYLGNEIGMYSFGIEEGLIFCYSVGSADGDHCGYGHGDAPTYGLTDELKNKILSKKAAFDAEVNNIVSTIPANAPDVWKEKLIYDRILIDSYYNLNAQWDGLAEDNWTAYGIIINKYGVCESYSEAFQTLLYAVGINSSGIAGYAGVDHKWNIVRIEGEWYMCDITFDDPTGGQDGVAGYHNYFNLTSSEMTSKDHDWSKHRWTVPNCTATTYGYAYFTK